MQPVRDLTSRRHAGWLTALDEIRDAQVRIDSATQLKRAEALLERLAEPRSYAELITIVDAIEFGVDALCNEGRTAEARALAADGDRLARTLERASYPNRPSSLVGFRAARVHALAIELDGDPEDAMHRLMGLYKRLKSETQLGDTRVEAVRVLRGVLSAARRAGGSRARLYADHARSEGDGLAEKVAAFDPRAAASYYHRAAIERRARQGSASQAEAISLFAASLPLRADTPRDRRSRGMVVGDLRVLRGERELGARILTETVLGFQDVLPRHYASAREQLIARDLLLAA